MSGSNSLLSGFIEVGQAVRRPERLACRWRDRTTARAEAPPSSVFVALLITAVLGLAAYGLTMGLHLGTEAMLLAAAKAPLAAGTAWAVALPSLYILNSALGSKLDASTTMLAALTTCSFGALAMLAGVPVNWFFTLALPFSGMRWLVNVVVFAGVGVAMTDTFLRVMTALEPKRTRAIALFWLGLVGIIGGELFALFDMFRF
jgi:hypothetical protein